MLCTGMLVCQTWWPGAPGNHWIAPPVSGRPAGVIHLPNVTASFIVTMVAVAPHLWLTSGRRLWLTSGRRLWLAMSLVGLSAGVILCQSTAGWLGMVLAVLLLGAMAWQRCQPDVMLAGGCIAPGALLAGFSRRASDVHHAFGRESRLQVWRACLALIQGASAPGTGLRHVSGGIAPWHAAHR
ncbi:hypothetical protein [Klebsiella aerogenes]|uniref:O-antigen ligase family protein n=1 Tax=Klebsiella aerogenes TaxID=548 RepID=UPI002FF8F9A6